MKVALAQIQATTDPRHNLQLIQKNSRLAHEQGVELIVFPEATMANFTAHLPAVAEPLEGPWVKEVQQYSNQYDIAIVAGMFTPAAEDHMYNTLILARPHQPLVHYHKIYLYDAFNYKESNSIAPGETATICHTSELTVGLATCYDIRFPDLFITLAAAGAQVIIVSACWGAGPDKLRQWKLLAQARAIDTGTWILACDQAPPTQALRSTVPLGVGHSLICSPWGEIVAELDNSPGLLIYEFDPQTIIPAREKMGVLTNRLHSGISLHEFV